MNTTELKSASADPSALADLEALIRHLIDQTPIDAELSRRVEERANRIMEETQQKHGYVDVDELLRDARDEL